MLEKRVEHTVELQAPYILAETRTRNQGSLLYNLGRGSPLCLGVLEGSEERDGRTDREKELDSMSDFKKAVLGLK